MSGSDCGDLPPIPPENRLAFSKELKDLLYPPKGTVVYSPKMAKRIFAVILEKVKKDPATVRRIAGSLRATPELDVLVAKEVQIFKGVAK